MLLLKDNNARVSLEGAEAAGPVLSMSGEEHENAKSVPYSPQTGRHPRPVFAPETSNRTSITYSNPFLAFHSFEKKKFLSMDEK